MLAWNYSDVFSKAACLSSAFKIDQINYVDTIKNYSGHKKQLKFYIDIGGDDLDQKLKVGNEDMVSALKSIGYNIDSEIIYFVDENAEHSEKSWAQCVGRILKLFFER